MMDRISEWVEMFLVQLGLTLTQLSAEESKTITLFLASLILAAAAAHALQVAALSR
jgi:hypothetical protein